MTAPYRRLIPFVALLLFGSVVQAEPPARIDAQGDPLPDGALARLGTTRFRADTFLNFFAVALAPDGKTLALNGTQGIRILDAATGKELRVLKAAGFSSYTCAAYSPDGEILGALDFPGRMQFWNPSTGEAISQVAPVEGGPGVFARDGNAFSFSNDGKTVAISYNNVGGDTKNSTTVYEVATGKPISHVELLHNFNVRAFLSGNGKLLVTIGQHMPQGGAAEPPEKQQEINQTLQMWDPTTGKEIRNLRNEAGGGFLSVAFSPDGKQMTTASPGGVLTIFDLATGKEVRHVVGRRNSGTFLAYSPDGKRLTVGSTDGVVQLWGAADGKRLALHDAPRIAYGRLAYTHDGKLLAFGGNGQSVYIWDVLAEKSLTPTGGHQAGITGIRFPTDGQGIITAASDGAVCFWDAAGKETRHLQLGRDVVTFSLTTTANASGVMLSSDGKHALGATQTGLMLFELAKGRDVCLFATGAFLERAVVAFSPDGRRLVVGSRDLRPREPPLRLYDVDSGRELRQFEGPLVTITAAAFSPDGKTIAAVRNFPRNRTAELRLWDTATGKSVWQIERPQSFMVNLAFAPNGKTLVILDQTGGLTLLDPANGKELRKIDGGFGTGNAAMLGFSPDGRLVAVAASAFTVRKTKIRVVEVITGSVRHEFTGHDGMITALAFSTDGKRLATGGNDTTVLLWDLTGQSGEEAPKGKLTAEDLVKLWTALGDSNVRTAHRALRRLEASPEEALALLTKQIQAGDKGSDADSIAKLIAALDSDSFDERQKAAADLAALGKAAETPLRKALTVKRSAESKQAIQELLDKIKDKPGVLPPEQVRPLRVVELLENVGTSEARKLLETLAKGAAEAPGTAAAKEALGRLDRAGKP